MINKKYVKIYTWNYILPLYSTKLCNEVKGWTPFKEKYFHINLMFSKEHVCYWDWFFILLLLQYGFSCFNVYKLANTIIILEVNYSWFCCCYIICVARANFGKQWIYFLITNSSFIIFWIYKIHIFQWWKLIFIKSNEKFILKYIWLHICLE